MLKEQEPCLTRHSWDLGELVALQAPSWLRHSQKGFLPKIQRSPTALHPAARHSGDRRGKHAPEKINASSKTLTIHQGKSETRKCFIGKVQKNQSLQLNLQQ